LAPPSPRGGRELLLPVLLRALLFERAVSYRLGLRCVVLLRLLHLDGVARFQLAQRLERPRDEGLAALQARSHLERQLAQEAGLDGLEAGLSALHQEDPLLVAGRARNRLAGLL